MPSVCFCKWSQTFFNGASRHPDKMPPQDLKMPSAIFHKNYKSCPDSTSVFSQIPSVCFCKWSQTLFNNGRHPDKMPPQDLKMPSAIFPWTPTSHALIQQFSAKCHQCVSVNDPRPFLMVPRHLVKMPPQDLKMPSAIFPQKATGHALIQHQFSAKCHQCVSANDPRLFLMVPLDILTKCHHKIWKCHQPFFHKPATSHALFQHQFSAKCH